MDGASNIFSPLSIAYILSLLAISSESETKKQLIDFLGIVPNTNELEDVYATANTDTMKMSNLMIISDRFELDPKYIQMIKNLSFIGVENFKYSERIVEKINKYVAANTHDLIDNVLSSSMINSSTIFLLVNTIYFKANWKYQFDKNETIRSKFHNTPSDMVDLMHQINRFDYFENNLIQLVELPYSDDNFVMGIILPKKFAESLVDYTPNNIPRFIVQEINGFISNLAKENVDLYIPKFTERQNIMLGPILMKLGITAMFDPLKANFQYVLDKNNGQSIYVDQIIHEAVIIVDESGTEAAAVSAITMKSTFVTEVKPPKIFKADHAFIFYIRDKKSGSVLFYGDYQGN